MKKSAFILLLMSAFAILSCKKAQLGDLAPEPELKGVVIRYDEGSKMIENSGIKVLIENSNPEISAITDAQGNFSLPLRNLPEFFTVAFEKEGVGTYKEYFRRAGADLYSKRPNGEYGLLTGTQTFQVGSKSTVIVNDLAAEVVNGKLKLNFTISSPNTTGEKYVRVLLQKDLPSLSLNTVANSIKNVGSTLSVQNGNNSFEFCMSCFMSCHEYAPGDKIYITAYGESLYSNWYTDLQSGQWKFPNINFVENNPVAWFIIP